MSAKHVQVAIQSLAFHMALSCQGRKVEEADNDPFVIERRAALNWLRDNKPAVSAAPALVSALEAFVAVMDSDEDGGEGIFEERLERLLPAARHALRLARGEGK